MDSRAGETEHEIQRQANKERYEHKLKLRKNKLNQILMAKKPPFSPSNAQRPQPNEGSEAEDKEACKPKKEEPSEPVGKFQLSKCKRKSKKKCWLCKSPFHLKLNCPKIKCFYCNKLGHVKKNCYKRKTDYIYNWLWNMNTKWRETFKEKYRRKIEICRKFKYSTYKKEGDTYKVYWKDQEVGEYYGPGTPRQFSSFNKTLPGSPDIRFVDAGIAKPKHLKELKLINGLFNRCGCGESSLTKKAFIKHVQDAHQGITLPETYVNQPPWVDWIFFYSDEAEIFYNDVEADWLSKG